MALAMPNLLKPFQSIPLELSIFLISMIITIRQTMARAYTIYVKTFIFLIICAARGIRTPNPPSESQ